MKSNLPSDTFCRKKNWRVSLIALKHCISVKHKMRQHVPAKMQDAPPKGQNSGGPSWAAGLLCHPTGRNRVQNHAHTADAGCRPGHASKWAAGRSTCLIRKGSAVGRHSLMSQGAAPALPAARCSPGSTASLLAQQLKRKEKARFLLTSSLSLFSG